MTRLTPEDIDAILPQTQCGLCGHGGCMPYAEAMLYDNAEINLCPPGGLPILKKLGDLLQRDITPFIEDMQTKAKPELLAVIREDECIGCTKCIQVCPVDAILGTGKKMHTVIADECNGCELCVPACPVDCIDLVTTAPPKLSITETIDSVKADSYRVRFLAREKRLAAIKKAELTNNFEKSQAERKKYLASALARTQKS